MDISIHSTKKHRVLGYYLKIVKSVISSPRTPFNKLYYADLYCGDGKCNIKITDKQYSYQGLVICMSLVSYLYSSSKLSIKESCSNNSSMNLFKSSIVKPYSPCKYSNS